MRIILLILTAAMVAGCSSQERSARERRSQGMVWLDGSDFPLDIRQSGFVVSADASDEAFPIFVSPTDVRYTLGDVTLVRVHLPDTWKSHGHGTLSLVSEDRKQVIQQTAWKTADGGKTAVTVRAYSEDNIVLEVGPDDHPVKLGSEVWIEEDSKGKYTASIQASGR